MQKRNSFLICLFTLFLIFNLSTIIAADEETLARQAEQAGQYREALTYYVKALQSASEGSSKDQELREKIIKLVQKIQPPPAVPEETIKFEGRAEAAVRNARTPEDYLDAAKEYRKALLLAPWVASYYFNLGVVLEKAGKPDEAIKSLRLYLLAAPNAPDVREVQKRIAGLDYEMERQAKAIEKKPERGFNGIWRYYEARGKKEWQITVSGSKLIASCIRFIHDSNKDYNTCYWVNDFSDFSGTVNGNEFTGTWNTHFVPSGQKLFNALPGLPSRELSIRGHLSSDGNELAIEFLQDWIVNGRWENRESWVKRILIRVE